MVPTGGGGLLSTGVPDSKIIFLNTAGFSLPKDGGPGAAGPYPRFATKFRGRRTRKRVGGREKGVRPPGTREGPLDIDITSVVNEKDTRSYIIRAN